MPANPDLHARIQSLSESGKRRLLDRLRSVSGSVRTAPPGGKLIAVVLSRADAEIDSAELRRYCEERLPAYMIPQIFASVEALPKTPAGKVDRQALRRLNWTPDSVSAPDIVAPRSAIEQILAKIWSDVLVFDDISVHDNFFEVGGDSLLTIRILSRAAKEGLRISPELFLANPTIAEQARLVEVASAASADSGPVVGPLPLTPIQHWFFSHIRTQAHQWNQSLLFRVEMSLDASALQNVVRALLLHHDALRSSFAFENGEWCANIDSLDDSLVLQSIDVSSQADTTRYATIQAVATELNTGLNLSKSPLLRIAHFATTGDNPDYLLLVAHHLVIDAESWRVLLVDLDAMLRQVESGKPIELPVKTTSFKSWATQLQAFARDKAAIEHRTFWRHYIPATLPQLPIDNAATSGNLEGDSRTISMAVDRSSTNTLLQIVSKQFRTRFYDTLVSALARTLCEWTSDPRVAFDTEGHGRESMFNDIDVSRTVGWFTTVFPVVLTAGDQDAWTNPVAALRLVKEQLQAIPRSGIGYGILRELSGDSSTANNLKQAPHAEILFNYLGKFDLDDKSILTLIDDRCGPARSMQCERAYTLEINARVTDGELRVDWTYNESLLDEETITRVSNRFAVALQELIDCVGDAENNATVVSDFPLIDLDDHEFDKLSAQIDSLDQD